MSEIDMNDAPPTLIPVYEPDLSGNEKRYVTDCLDTGWISSLGVYVDRFEKAFSEITRAEHVLCVSNGTVALHLALHCLDIGPGDEVIVPTFTYIASVNTIAQTGATPIFAECRKGDWLIDPDDVRSKITPRTKALLPVHLYGAVCDMAAICKLARDHKLYVIEDCAEALGSTRGGQHVGTFGDVGTFSFFGNKTVTTGEGGMIIAREPALAERLRRVKGQGQSSNRRYWHTELGFNYRMTNICAAIGLAQIERLDQTLARKREIGALYRSLLGDLPVTFQSIPEDVRGSDWLVSLLLPQNVDRDRIIEVMRSRGVDTRPVFYCAHQMPMYQGGQSPVSEDISARGLSLPSYPRLTTAMITRVADTLRGALSTAASEISDV